jgi:hypothetical protein
MKYTIVDDNNTLCSLFQHWANRADDIRIVTAWASMKCPTVDELIRTRRAISTMVVGFDFYQTDPAFLRKFSSVVRIGKAERATFHPKLYLFTKGRQFGCILGSSNFTGGGFETNTEVNILAEGRTNEPLYKSVRQFIDEQEKGAEPLRPDELLDYEQQHRRLARHRSRLARFRPSKAAGRRMAQRIRKEKAAAVPPSQLNISWDEFVALVRAHERRRGIQIQTTGTAEPGYFSTIDHAQALFRKYGSLSKMSLDDRRFVAGTIAGSGWFGSMKGSGAFAQRVIKQPRVLDKALDHIPRTGAVNQSQFAAFAREYTWPNAGVVTASRLLAMKRPDLFVCIDSKNRKQIANALGMTAVDTRSFEGYWELTQRIWKCPWRRAKRPTGSFDVRLWRSAVAMLDCIYYED